MFLELGFLHAIYDSTTLPIDRLNAELLMVSPLRDDVNPSKPFPRERLEQARAVDGVVDVYPLFLTRRGLWKSSGLPIEDGIRVWGFDPGDPVFRIPGFEAARHLLERPDTALFDRRRRDTYGGLEVGGEGLLDGRRLELVGEVELGPDLQMNANLFVSDRTFANLFRGPETVSRAPERVEIGLLRLPSGRDPEPVRRALAERLPDDVVLLTPEELSRKVRAFWTRNQPVAAVFGLGLVVGFAIGVMICYQILFTDIVDQRAQYATLKAMGYRNGDLVLLALRRALYLAALAAAVGLPVAAVAYGILEGLTGLLFQLTPLRVAVVLLLTAAMCSAASLLAIREAVGADPAELFG